MSASLGLYRLQLLDSRIDQIHSRQAEIRQILEDDEELRQAKSLVADAETGHTETLKELKRAEAEVEKQKIKIQQTEASLYSGSVKNPKELQDLQNESAALKRFLATLEDRLLEAMLAEETAEETYQNAKEALEQVQARLAAQNQNLLEEQSNLNKELEKLDAEHQAAISPLNDDLLDVYYRLRQQRRGLAVATLSDGACAACGTTLTPAQQQSARSTSQIYNCPTCGRILFAN